MSLLSALEPFPATIETPIEFRYVSHLYSHNKASSRRVQTICRKLHSANYRKRQTSQPMPPNPLSQELFFLQTSGIYIYCGVLKLGRAGNFKTNLGHEYEFDEMVPQE
jgi:hypothetical protein